MLLRSCLRYKHFLVCKIICSSTLDFGSDSPSYPYQDLFPVSPKDIERRNPFPLFHCLNTDALWKNFQWRWQQKEDAFHKISNLYSEICPSLEHNPSCKYFQQEQRTLQPNRAIKVDKIAEYSRLFFRTRNFKPCIISKRCRESRRGPKSQHLTWRSLEVKNTTSQGFRWRLESNYAVFCYQILDESPQKMSTLRSRLPKYYTIRYSVPTTL